MRGLGMVLLSGAAAVVLWKVFAAMFIGILGMVFKAALIFAVEAAARRSAELGAG